MVPDDDVKLSTRDVIRCDQLSPRLISSTYHHHNNNKYYNYYYNYVYNILTTVSISSNYCQTLVGHFAVDTRWHSNERQSAERQTAANDDL